MEKLKEITAQEAQDMFSSSSSDGYTGLSWVNAKKIAEFLNGLIRKINVLEERQQNERH